jgi:hypothetical protein
MEKQIFCYCWCVIVTDEDTANVIAADKGYHCDIIAADKGYHCDIIATKQKI